MLRKRPIQVYTVILTACPLSLIAKPLLQSPDCKALIVPSPIGSRPLTGVDGRVSLWTGEEGEGRGKGVEGKEGKGNEGGGR